MVKFEYHPWKEIVVHEVIRYPLDHFINTRCIGIQPGGLGRPITWANGIIFEILHFRDTDDIIKEKIKGKIHWSAISYCILPNFQHEFKVNEGNIRIPIINLSDNAVFNEMAEWIKKNFEKIR